MGPEKLAAKIGQPLEGQSFRTSGEAIAMMIAMFFHALPRTSDGEIDAGIDAIAADAKHHYRNFKPLVHARDH